MTAYLKLSGPPGLQAAALKAAHSDMVRQDENGKDVLGNVFTHDIALLYVDDMPGGPFIMVLFLDDDQKLPGTLPAGLTKAWEAGGAPVVWAGR